VAAATAHTITIAFTNACPTASLVETELEPEDDAEDEVEDEELP
jgi:hypothetical protein